MAISIKDPETDALARALAQEIGLSITEAVKQALSEALTRARRAKQQDQLAEEILKIGERAAEYVTNTASATDHAVRLYDEQGLPK